MLIRRRRAVCRTGVDRVPAIAAKARDSRHLALPRATQFSVIIVTDQELRESMGPTPERSREHTLATIGTLIVVGQVVERAMDVLLTFVVQDGHPLTLERLMHLEAAHRKKTLGFFIHRMKERASFDPDFDETLERYLENRNRLIHRFAEVPGHSLATVDDLAKVDEFLSQLLSDFQRVLVFCMALLHAWTQQTGIAKDITDQLRGQGADELWNQVTSLSPQIDQFIFAKETSVQKPATPTSE